MTFEAMMIVLPLFLKYSILFAKLWQK